MNLYLEITAVVLNLIFLILLIRELQICWLFGIAASLVSVLLFFNQQLYSESLLYGFYAVIGLYGWLVWAGRRNAFAIKRLRWHWQAVFIVCGSVVVYFLGSFMQTKDASMAYEDAFSTVFSVFASFMEIYKIISAWIYWIILNAFSIYLYGSKELWIYAALMGLYVLLSVYGLRNWLQKYNTQQA